jgi:hypothetical protein
MVRLEGLGKLKIFNDLIGTRTDDLPVCSEHLNQLRYSVPHGQESKTKHKII